MGRYAQMQTAMKVVSDLDKQEGTLYWLIAAEPDEKDRDTLTARAEKDFKQLRRGRDAADMCAFGAARREIQNLLPSEKEDWLRKNWSGSKQGYERALAELTDPTGVLKRATPMETRMVQTLEYVLQKSQMSDQDLIGSTLWQLGLSPARLDELRHNIGAWERKRRAAEEDPDLEKSGLAGLAGLVDPAVDKRVQADADALLDAVENGTVGEWKAALDAAERGETGVLVAANGPLDGLLSGDGEEKKEDGDTDQGDEETSWTWPDEGGGQYGDAQLTPEAKARMIASAPQRAEDIRKLLDAIGDNVAEIPQAAVHGSINALNEAIDLADEAVSLIAEVDLPHLPNVDAPQDLHR